MSSFHRVFAGLVVAGWVVLFQFGADLLALEGLARSMWLAVPALGVPLAASLACALAAWLSEGSDRRAWRNFAVGGALYFFGNLCYLYYGLNEDRRRLSDAAGTLLPADGGVFHRRACSNTARRNI